MTKPTNLLPTCSAANKAKKFSPKFLLPSIFSLYTFHFYFFSFHNTKTFLPTHTLIFAISSFHVSSHRQVAVHWICSTTESPAAYLPPPPRSLLLSSRCRGSIEHELKNIEVVAALGDWGHRFQGLEVSETLLEKVKNFDLVLLIGFFLWPNQGRGAHSSSYFSTHKGNHFHIEKQVRGLYEKAQEILMKESNVQDWI
ncbi:uncharacterized protein LOC133716512 [Rosa rugosa]|uniref:uncharacterized protein LOC133716512 n=1 Tax=Rosa rugosa TaxID=74645 RepID=UPI002B40D378|nr:uncharacterized protein LOC133716512 [Rosa rugosa]